MDGVGNRVSILLPADGLSESVRDLLTLLRLDRGRELGRRRSCMMFRIGCIEQQLANAEVSVRLGDLLVEITQ